MHSLLINLLCKYRTNYLCPNSPDRPQLTQTSRLSSGGDLGSFHLSEEGLFIMHVTLVLLHLSLMTLFRL